MMTEEKYARFDHMSALAERIAARCVVEPPLFSEHGGFTRDQVVMLAEGYLAGRRLGAWIPVTRQMYENRDFRASLIERAASLWRGSVRSHLFDANLLIGPKGKLPS